MKFKEERLSSLQAKANSIAKIAAYGISSGMYFEDHAASEVEIEKLIKTEEIRYVIISKDDSTFYEYNSFTAVLNDYKNNNENISTKYEIMKAYAPISVNDVKIGDIYMGFSLATVYDKIDELQTNIGIISLLLFIIGSVVVFFIGKVFTQPLTKIVAAVNKIAEGDYSQHVDIKSNDEVGFLANSFNEMSEKITISNREMDKIKKELENRVRDRTHELEGALRSLQKENIERKKAEVEISSSLHEKEVLLKEIHHRVKNNLQIVSSLFFFQSKQLSDPQTIEMFRDGQNRVKSMALIHEKLYQSGDLANIDFKEYVKKLTNFLFQSYGVNQTKIKLKNNVQKVELGVDTAVPCGLIINELISNSLKHGLSESENGEIKIDMGYDENHKLILKISDNGKGIPKNFNIEKSESLGLRLVYNLTMQLNGKVEFFNNNGTIVKINFPDPNLIKKAS
ncbi:MAG: HAMP domain-containing protein [Ignavibacteriae bacterium]|nr:HAMP domain-containing protein [Ignavibacteriota bacterium]MCB9205971.1 HAMP domain-containing protein [Ignavibacteriales bacterium]MCB9209248.1 HAMP domain-containing protein [Ignavibacteriales bacterium]MCB9257890.1 HAMP domain-containing protein [Ignavibacteriales bacterium]